jgi:shikimate 5-dehydrogenase
MKAATGLTMLVAQAKYACELFLGEALPDSLITEIVEELQNV